MEEFDWWIEVSIGNLFYVYYVEAFESFYEAKRFEDKYLQDLDKEKAEIVNILVKQCKAKELITKFRERNKEQKGFAIIKKNLDEDILLNKVSKLAEIICFYIDLDINPSSA